jgi:RNase P subunit RPR2
MVSLKNRKRKKRLNERKENKFIAYEAMNFLIEEAMKNRLSNPQYSQELFSAARKLCSRTRIHIPSHYHFHFCRSCYYPLSTNSAKIRLNSKKKQIHYQCLICKKEHRFGYLREQKKRKK